MSLGSTLLKHRKRNNFSQQKVASFLEVSRSTYCDWESDTSFPRTENIMKIANLYKIELNELLNNDKPVNIFNSPNTINNSPNSKVETPEALLKVPEGLERLVNLIEKIVQNKN